MEQLFKYDILNRQPPDYTLTSVTSNGRTTWTLKDDLGAIVLQQRGKEGYNREILQNMRCDMNINLKAVSILTTAERDTIESQIDEGEMIINKTTNTTQTLFDGNWI